MVSSQDHIDAKEDQEVSQEEEILEILQKHGKGGAPEIDTRAMFRHQFWDTQPVPKLSEAAIDVKSGPIEPSKNVDDVRKEAFALPATFEWVTCDVTSATELQEIYTLLNENYVEDEDCLFRFDYSAEFLRWALTPPGYKPEWHIGVRAVASKKLVGFITGIPSDMKVEGTSMKMAEVNFLCVHKKLRSKRLAPVLIKEITRRVNLCDIWQAAYTAGVFIPRPVTSCRYYHRSLNPKKLVEVGFSRLAPRMTLARTIKLYKTLDQPKTKGFREMTEKDIGQVKNLLEEKLSEYKLHPVLSEDDVRHWLLPRKKVVFTYVVEESGGQVTDFASFYSLPSSVLGNDKHPTLFAAYQFWTVARTVSLSDLTNDLFVHAKSEGFDVFNALDLMENQAIFEPLKFGIGDGLLHYYLYNWQTGIMKPSEIGLILL
jgi:glycylpeptide N-tetradecanoyltransferase